MNPKQERFCKEYIIDLNATQAAIRAGYSKKTAGQIGERLLKNVEIQKFVSELQKKREERTEITGDMVVRELAKIGFANVQDFLTGGNSINDISEIDQDKAAAIGSIETTTTVRGKGEDQYTERTTKIKIWDKTKALEQLGRHTGIFEKDNDQLKPSVTLAPQIILNPKKPDKK